MAPIVNREASTSSSNCFCGSGYVRVGAEVTLRMRAFRASAHSFVHLKGTSFFVRFVRGLARAAKFLMKGRWYPSTPKVCRTCFTVRSVVGHSEIPVTLAGSIRSPSFVISHLSKVIEDCINWHLVGFRK